jgi:hypothetical protein
MPGKKAKGASSGEGQLFVILHDEKNSRHFLSSRDQLMFSKKDNLKVGTFATFSGNGDRSSRCRCLVVISGKLFNQLDQNYHCLFLSQARKNIVKQVCASSTE